MFVIPNSASSEARSLARALGVTITLGDVLHRRGYSDEAKTRRFLDPRLSDLSSPRQMAGRASAIDRITRAVRARERMVVFGDYDCDGITSVAILTEVIRELGGEVIPLLADRFRGGYGVSDQAADMIRAAGGTLLVTCDCGSSDHVRLERLARDGMDAVVIDHHLVPDEPLPAVAFLNPNRPDCPFEYKHLASCGLALSLAAGLRTGLGRDLDVRNWLDLVAIGTVADVVPLDRDNRILVRAGMRLMETSPRPGVRWLAEHARLSLASGMTAEMISFDLGPRINAPGRLGSAMPALELLMLRDEPLAREMSGRIEEMRTQRKRIQECVMTEALAEIEANGYARDPAIVVGKEGWHLGVVGIVAAQLVDRLAKPVVVIGFSGTLGRGSVRGPKGIPIYDLLDRSRDAPMSFGGHQAAAGIQIEQPALERFRELFNAAAQEILAARAETRESQRLAAAEALLAPEDAVSDVVADLRRLEPCGMDNPSPPLAIVGARIARARAVKGGHLQVTLVRDRGETLHGFGLAMGELAKKLLPSGTVNVVGHLKRDNYRGGNAVALRIESIETLA